MDGANQKKIQSLHLSFIAKILSTYTHEMKNHLAIIKESSGLMQDMFQFGKPPKRKKDMAPFLTTLQAIDDQVKRSIGVINILNRFGHRMDRPTSGFDVNEIIEELIVLMHRLANQKGITLEAESDNDVPAAHGNPSRLQLILYTLILEAFESLRAGSKIIFRTSATNAMVVIAIRTEGEKLGASSESSQIFEESFLKVIQVQNGEIEQQQDPAEIRISIPLTKH